MNFTILPENLTLSSWLTYWLDVYIKPVLKPSAYEHYRENCTKHIIPHIGDLPMNEITSSILQQFLNLQGKSGNLRTGGALSPKSMRNMRVILGVAFKQAMADGVIHANPVPLTALPRCRAQHVEIMTDEMQEAAEKYLFRNYYKSYYHPPILFAMYTGIRRGELCALRWKDYNEKTGRLSISQTVRRLTNYDAAPCAPRTALVFGPVKSDQSDRELTMPPIARSILNEQKELYTKKFGVPAAENFIFCNASGNLIDPDNLGHYFNKLFNRLGLGHVKFHATRHTFATRAIENGIDVATISGILGHADVTTTTHFYVHPRDKAMRAAMETIEPIYSGTPLFSPPQIAASSGSDGKYFCML